MSLIVSIFFLRNYWLQSNVKSNCFFSVLNIFSSLFSAFFTLLFEKFFAQLFHLLFTAFCFCFLPSSPLLFLISLFWCIFYFIFFIWFNIFYFIFFISYFLFYIFYFIFLFYIIYFTFFLFLLFLFYFFLLYVHRVFSTCRIKAVLNTATDAMRNLLSWVCVAWLS